MAQINELSELLTVLRNSESSIEININHLRKILGKTIKIRFEYNVEVPYNNLNLNTDVNRLLLTSDRSKSDFTRKLISQCNGIVLDCTNWNVLSMPPHMFNPKCSLTAAINTNDYKIYAIDDGTTVTMYWYDNKWCLSSTNGFDISHYKWMGDKTYIQAFNEVAAAYPNFNFDHLDKNKCYTIGFRHNDFHPLLKDTNHMWLIQSCDLTAINSDQCNIVIDYPDIGIPIQRELKINNKGRQLISWINHNNTNAYNNYIATSAGDNKPNIHYGYIIRSVSCHIDIMIESSLLRHIRTLIYNIPYRYNSLKDINAHNRIDYLVLKSYLANDINQSFIHLFPQFNQKYEEYKNIFNDIADQINYMIHKSRYRNVSYKKYDNTLSKLAEILFEDVNKYTQIHSNNNTKNIIHDFIVNKRYLELYFNTLY